MISQNEKPNILVVDDNATNIRVLVSSLETYDYRVITARNGKMGLKRAKFIRPDLILLDIMMPDMDGFEVCRQLKQDIELQDIPVIFLTAKTASKDVVEGLRLGAVDYITKPFHHEELRTRVQTHLTLQAQKKQLHQQAEILRQTNTQLVELNQEKNEILGIASHDLKNPLSTIIGGTELIENTLQVDGSISNEELTEILQLINYSTDRMVILINNLLNVNVIESDEMQLSMTKDNILPLVQQVVLEYRPKAEAKHITIHFSPDSNVYLAYIDLDVTYQILDNLISNAVKYTPFGGNICVKILKNTDNMVWCEIHDDGPGLSQEDQTKLFGKFNRLTPRPTNDETSTGLGLFIVKKLITMMGGEVWCDSELGKGSTFVIQFATTQGDQVGSSNV